ncbi:MAG TPA: hypothetical protein VI386_02575 [Candidatus Sulfotelmatobacter sp.]
MAKLSNTIIVVLAVLTAGVIVIWFVWSEKSHQAARNLIQAQKELNFHEAQQKEELLNLQIDFGYQLFGRGSKGKTYESCLRFPPEQKENQKKCELLSTEVKRKEKALKPW